ncbi:tumor necrosis factor ligand superfamily member 13-like [Branchiostoma lanceolatum]|uniref:tumor necrosis factor ligand superfamily member 13-like n=1 Tax=Branchiostoma lanceolatum TaxID=7740 RepID=UPI0034570D4F
MAEETELPKSYDNAGNQKANRRAENLPWCFLQGFLLCVVVVLAYRNMVVERENAELSGRLMEVERKLQGLDRKVQTLWNEEDQPKNDKEVQSGQINRIDDDASAKRMKRDKPLETASIPLVEEQHVGRRDVIGVHVQAHSDEQAADPEKKDYKIPKGHDILTKWDPLSNPGEGFHLMDGYLYVKRTGLYFIYSQILYIDDPNAAPGIEATNHSVVVNKEVFLTCVHSMVSDPPWDTCHTAGIHTLEAGSSIAISIKCDECTISLSSDTTFFGAVMLKEYEQKSSSSFDFVSTFF